jgi:hypothetical protein
MTFRQVSQLGAVALLGILAQPAFAVYELVEIQLSANKLAGTVLDTSGAPAADVNVSLHQCTFRADGGMAMKEQILSATKTDASGHFRFPSELRPRTACLSFHAEGFNPLLVKIKWRKSASPLEIKMPIGG